MMHGFLSDIIPFFLYAFTSIFVIVNPIGGSLTFISLTRGLPQEDITQTARRSVTVACVLAVIFALTGEAFLRLFNITVDSLRVAGGILLFFVAIDMLHARRSRESVTPEEIMDASKREDVSVFPLAIPLLTGPGAITTVIVVIRTGSTVEHKAVTVLTILLIFLISYYIFRFSHRLNRFFGMTFSLVINRLMGLMLGAIAVDFVATGAWNIFQGLAGR